MIGIGGSGAVGVTDGLGRATVRVPLSTSPGTTQIQASFGGDATHAASSDSAAPFTIAKATASLSPFSAFVTQTPTTNTGAVTTLSAALGGPLPVPLTTSPLIQRTVTFTLTGPVNRTISTITDFLGQAKLPKGLPAGTYNVTATFDGDSTFTSATRTGSLVIAPFTGFFSPVDSLPTLNTVNAGSSIPVKFSLGGNRGPGDLRAGLPAGLEDHVRVGRCRWTRSRRRRRQPAASSTTRRRTSTSTRWKTPKNYAGLCYRLDLKMIDGSAFSANFKFK